MAACSALGNSDLSGSSGTVTGLGPPPPPPSLPACDWRPCSEVAFGARRAQPAERLDAVCFCCLQAALFVGAGVDKIRLTGGEPTLRPDLVSLVQRLHDLPGRPALGLTSNGIALRRSLQNLRVAGADSSHSFLGGKAAGRLAAICTLARQAGSGLTSTYPAECFSVGGPQDRRCCPCASSQAVRERTPSQCSSSAGQYSRLTACWAHCLHRSAKMPLTRDVRHTRSQGWARSGPGAAACLATGKHRCSGPAGLRLLAPSLGALQPANVQRRRGCRCRAACQPP